MPATSSILQPPIGVQIDLVKKQLRRVADGLLSSLPLIDQLPAEGRREIIGRYTAVLEGNFIDWMTGAHLAARSEEARSIIQDNLIEEVRDSHPRMLRTFAMAA